MPFVLLVAIGFGLVVDSVAARMRGVDEGLRWVALPLVGLPVLLLPGLAWAESGDLHPVAYPAEWHQVAAQLEAAGAGDDRVAVLPWSTYVRYPWNGDRAALDPAIRFFPGEVITSEDLVLGDDRVVQGENSRARAIGRAVDEGTPLTPVLKTQGVRWVLIEKGVPSSHPVSAPDGKVVHDGGQLTLVDLGEVARLPAWWGAPIVILADVATVAGFLVVALSRRRGKGAGSGSIQRRSTT